MVILELRLKLLGANSQRNEFTAPIAQNQALGQKSRKLEEQENGLKPKPLYISER